MRGLKLMLTVILFSGIFTPYFNKSHSADRSRDEAVINMVLFHSNDTDSGQTKIELDPVEALEESQLIKGTSCNNDLMTFSNTIRLTDQIPPDMPNISVNYVNWESDDIRVMIQHGYDTGGSGVERSQYRVDKREWQDYSGPFTLKAQDRAQVLTARTIDRAGHISQLTHASLQIERTRPAAPKIMLSSTDYTKEAVGIQLTGPKAGEEKVQYRIGEMGVWTDYTRPFQFEASGRTTVYARTLSIQAIPSDVVSADVKIEPASAIVTGAVDMLAVEQWERKGEVAAKPLFSFVKEFIQQFQYWAIDIQKRFDSRMKVKLQQPTIILPSKGYWRLKREVIKVSERKRNKYKNNLFLASRLQRISVILAAVVLLQSFGIAIAPLKTYAASHMYNFNRYEAVAIPYGPWTNHFGGDPKANGGTEGTLIDWHIKAVMYQYARFDSISGEYVLYGNKTTMEIRTANTNTNDYDIRDYPYVASISSENRQNPGYEAREMPQKTLRVARYSSYDQSEREARFTFNDYTAIPSGYNYSPGNFVTTVQAADGAYPDHGRAADGYFYVKGSVVNAVPSVAITSAGTHYISVVNGYNTITISGTATDTDGDTLTIMGNLGGVTKSTTIYPGVWSLTWSGSELTEGITSMNVNVSDGYGGTASAWYSGSIIVDKTAPTAPTITVDRSGWYNGNKMITITHGSDSHSGVQKTQLQIGTGGWTDYTAPFTVNERITVNARTIDKAGNISAISSLDTQIDKTTPSAPTVTSDHGGWYNGNKMITITNGQVGPSGIQKSQLQINNGNWTDYTTPLTVSERVTVNARTLDQAGNISAVASLDTQIDKIPPQKPTLVHGGGSDWQNRDTTINITHGIDSGGSEIKETQYRINTGNWETYTTPIILSEEGQTVYARTWDHAGNVSSEASSEAKIDITPPTSPIIEKNTTGDTTGNVEISILPGTDTVSGVKMTEYKVGVTSVWQTYSGPITVTEEGEHQIFARSIDFAGNHSGITNGTIVIDRTAPTVPSISLSTNNHTRESVQFKISGSVDTRGLRYEYKLGNGIYVSGEQGEVTEDGITVITARAVDEAGNISAETTTTVRIDKTDPVIHISPSQRGWSQEMIKATIQYQDHGSGINPDRRYYRVTSSPQEPDSWELASSNSFQVNVTQEGIWYIHAKVEDNVGNSTVASSSALHLQQPPIAPELSVQSIGLNQAALQWTLPSGKSFTGGYEYTLRNLSNGQGMNLTYPGDWAVDHSLSSGTSYEYELTVRNHVGEAVSHPVRLLTLPAAPRNLSLYPVDREAGHITVSFDAVKSADSYRIVAFNMDSQQEVYNQTVTTSVYQPIVNLQPDTVYNVTVSAINATGEGPTTSQSILSLPDAPDGFKSVAIGENFVDLAWHSVTTATYYTLDRNNAPVTASVYEAFSDIGLSSGTAYNYRLSAINATGPSAYSHMNVLTLPGMVDNLTVVEARRNELSIVWNQVRGASGYRMVVNGGQEYVFGAHELQATIPNLPAGTPANISIQSLNSSGLSVTSSTYGLTLPDQLGELNVSDIRENSAVISWAPVHGATTYEINVNDRKYTVSGTHFVVQGLTGGTTYQIQIAAGNSSGFGESLKGRFITQPTQVLGFTAENPEDRSFTLAWEPVKGAIKYIVYQGKEELGVVSEARMSVLKLEPGINYTYEVIAVNESGNGLPGEFYWRTYPSPVKQNDVWIKDITTSRATAEWNQIPGADYYQVYLDGKLLGDTMDLSYSFEGFDSSERHVVSVEPVNSSGTSKPYEVSFETLPDSEFSVEVESRHTSITITVGNTQPNDTIVIMNKGMVIYKGRDPVFVWEPLKSGTSYELDIWTENGQGARSSTKNIKERTKSSAKTFTPMTATTEMIKEENVINNGSQINDSLVTIPASKEASGEESSNFSGAGFKDIERTFNRAKIQELADRGIVRGTSDKTYEPGREVTRVEFTSMIVRALQLPEEDTILTFTDIQPTEWYIPELKSAIRHVVARGFSDDVFAPNQLISREQASKMLGNVTEQDGTAGGEERYNDELLIAGWAREEVLGLTQLSLLQGYPDGTFRPKHYVTRAEAAEMIYNLLHYLN
ncbi:OmpL47-type beta-barrel domain-containing protein [Paenibacillus massiliensis]|uniref:OmpL47-type beta-barrel domain-containing protein n=1 Tax=Paenibacillus massiliensis TaxID=225917 RepID=UPI0004073872|nr:S-layer homology domain-containing protein [Paenibacillus massiliensis]